MSAKALGRGGASCVQEARGMLLWLEGHGEEEPEASENIPRRLQPGGGRCPDQPSCSASESPPRMAVLEVKPLNTSKARPARERKRLFRENAVVLLYFREGAAFVSNVGGSMAGNNNYNGPSWLKQVRASPGPIWMAGGRRKR